jgi:hypothetical protein
MSPTEIAAIIAATTAALGAIAGYLVKAQEIKNTAHTQEEATALDGYNKLTAALQTRLEIVEQKLFQAEKRIGELECENALLRNQVSDLKSCVQT